MNGTNKKIRIVISISIAVVLIVSLAAAYFLVSSKSPRQFYLEAEAKNFKKYADQIKQAYKDFYAAQKPYMDNRYKNRLELTADIKSDAENPFGLSNAKDIFDILRRCKLVVDSSQDPAGKKSLTRLSLLLEKAPLIDADVYTRDRQMGVAIPVFLPEKYFILSLDNMDPVYDRLEKRYNLLPIKPKRIFRMSDVAKTVRFSDGEFDSIIKDYGTLISGLLGKEDVKYGKDVTLKIGNEEKKGREVVVALDADKTKKLLQGIADKAAGDDLLLRLTCENYADVIKLVDEAGFFQLFRVLDESGYLKLNGTIKSYLDKINVTKDLAGFKDSIKKYGNTTVFPEGLKMTAVVDSTGNILDRTVTVGNKEKTAIDIHTRDNDVKNDDFGNGLCDIRISTPGEDGQMQTLVWTINTNITPLPKNDDRKGIITISHTVKKGTAEEFSLQVKLDIDDKTDELTLKKNSLMKCDIRFKGGETTQTDSLTGEISTVSWKNNKQKTRNANTTFTVNADLPSFNLKNTSLKLDWKREDRLEIDDFSIPEVQVANMVDLNTITDDGLAKVEDEMLASFGSFYLQNKGIMDAIMGQ